VFISELSLMLHSHTVQVVLDMEIYGERVGDEIVANGNVAYCICNTFQRKMFACLWYLCTSNVVCV